MVFMQCNVLHMCTVDYEIYTGLLLICGSNLGTTALLIHLLKNFLEKAVIMNTIQGQNAQGSNASK